jgi:D-lyxose ketol-isomerase
MIVEKEWGYEEYLTDQETYTGKRLHIKFNKISSVHSHINKTETFVCESGLIHIVIYLVQESGGVLTLNPNIKILTPTQSVTILPGTWHSFYCGTSGTILEFSDKHTDYDVYRLFPSGELTLPPTLKRDILIENTDWEKFKAVLSNKSE